MHQERLPSTHLKSKTLHHSQSTTRPSRELFFLCLLSLHHSRLVSRVSFGFLELEESELAIVDPTDEEENVLSGRLIFAINGHGEICSMRKSGGCPVESDAIMRCLQLAGLRATEIIATVETQVHESLRARGTRIRLSLISYLEAPK